VRDDPVAAEDAGREEVVAPPFAWQGWSWFDKTMMLGRHGRAALERWIRDELEFGSRVAWDWCEQAFFGERRIQWQFKMMATDAWLATAEGQAALDRAKCQLLDIEKGQR
jgi:hypothetical protein